MPTPRVTKKAVALLEEVADISDGLLATWHWSLARWLDEADKTIRNGVKKLVRWQIRDLNLKYSNSLLDQMQRWVRELVENSARRRRIDYSALLLHPGYDNRLREADEAFRTFTDQIQCPAVGRARARGVVRVRAERILSLSYEVEEEEAETPAEEKEAQVITETPSTLWERIESAPDENP